MGGPGGCGEGKYRTGVLLRARLFRQVKWNGLMGGFVGIGKEVGRGVRTAAA